MLAQHAGAFQANRGAAAVVIRARGCSLSVVVIAIAGIVVSADHEDAAGIRRIAAAQHGIDIGES